VATAVADLEQTQDDQLAASGRGIVAKKRPITGTRTNSWRRILQPST